MLVKEILNSNSQKKFDFTVVVVSDFFDLILYRSHIYIFIAGLQDFIKISWGFVNSAFSDLYHFFVCCIYGLLATVQINCYFIAHYNTNMCLIMFSTKAISTRSFHFRGRGVYLRG